MNLFPHALMREMGYYIFFIQSELKCGFGTSKHVGILGGLEGWCSTPRGVWHPAVAMGIPWLQVSQQGEQGVSIQPCAGPMLAVPAQLYPSSSLIPPSLLCSESLWSLGSGSNVIGIPHSTGLWCVCTGKATRPPGWCPAGDCAGGGSGRGSCFDQQGSPGCTHRQGPKTSVTSTKSPQQLHPPLGVFP